MRILAATFLMLWVATGSAALAAPRVALVGQVHDFGTVSQGKKVTHSFTISNRGDSPLIIKSVRPSCGCTAVNASASVIAPGKTGEIKASFDSTAYAGSVQKFIAVETNDPQTPSINLTLKGIVAEEIRISPRQLNLGRLKNEATTRTALTVTNMGKTTISITDIRSSLSQVIPAPEKKTLRPSESARIALAVTPRKGDRLLSGYITIVTNSRIRPEISVPIYGSPQ